MALRQLKEQIQQVQNSIVNAQLYSNPETVGVVDKEFKKLCHMLDGLTSFTDHRWQVKLYTEKQEVVTFDLRAENLEHAKEMAENIVDENDDVIRFELHCDGIPVPAEDYLY